MISQADIVGFEARYIPEPNSGCWLWLGAMSGFYGKWKNDGAHRFSYISSGKSIPDGLVIDHKCKNKICVNPDHLEPVTSKENTMRGHGPTSVNAKKTHCSKGHALEGANLRVRFREGQYRRECLECQRQHMINFRARAALQGETK